MAELLRQHQAGRNDLSQHLWALLILELWHRVYIDNDYSSRRDLTFADLDAAPGRTTDHGPRTTDPEAVASPR